MLKPNVGRALSAIGAGLLIVSLFLTWYHIDRSAAAGSTTSTGWDTFPRLRIVLLLGAVLTVASALVAQVRWVLVARTLLGLGLAALILRRIVDPPDISAPVVSQGGVYLGLVSALLVALGGLVDTGRRVAVAYPGLGFRRPMLPPTGGTSATGRAADDPNAPPGDVVVHVPNDASQR